MKEFIEKMIGRLEEETHAWNDGYRNGIKSTITIVNQLAEEYNNESVKTNADYIRNMTDEELARLFDSDLGSITINFHCEECNNRLNCDVCYLKWLQSEVEG